MSNHKPVKIALLGCGTVGTEVARLLLEQAGDLAARAGAPLQLIGIGVRDLQSPRAQMIDRKLFTTDIDNLIDRADLVIELIGGIEPARTFVLRALQQGISVATGNKALLAAHGPQLYEAAAKTNADLYFEAAVAGAVPVVYGLRESLAGDQVSKVFGIVNGTTNYILDQMSNLGWSFEQALAKAQELGFAEADPSADVDGLDAGAKCAILASLAFHTRVSIDDVSCEGIRSVTAQQVAQAQRDGYVIKLLAIAQRDVDGGANQSVSVRVHPTLVDRKNPLASVSGAFNAVVIEAAAAGRLMFYGQGAGGAPTASAVLGDVVAGASHIAGGGSAPLESSYASLPVRSIGQVASQYCLRLRLVDRPGSLAEVMQILGSYGISIRSMSQDQGSAEEMPLITIFTHTTTHNQIEEMSAHLEQNYLDARVESVMRVEGI